MDGQQTTIHDKGPTLGLQLSSRPKNPSSGLSSVQGRLTKNVSGLLAWMLHK